MTSELRARVVAGQGWPTIVTFSATDINPKKREEKKGKTDIQVEAIMSAESTHRVP